MDKDRRKSVNFEKTAELNVYNDDWDDDFDDENPEMENETVENIELTEVEPVEYRKDGHTTLVPLNSSNGRRRNSMMRRNTVYEPKPDGFICDPTLASPIEARVVTDICCFLLFIFLLLIWIFSTCLVLNMGNLDRFDVPLQKLEDGKPVLCGIDPNEQDKYEFNFNLFKCLDPLVAFRKCPTKSICVEKCPEKSFSFPHYRKMNEYNSSAKPKPELLRSIQCIGDTKYSLRTMEDVEKYIGMDQCAEITPKSFNLGFKCIPDILETEIDFIIDLLDNIIPQTNIPWRITYEFTKLVNDNSITTNSSLNHKMYTFSNMLQGWPVSIVFIIVAIILTLVLIYSMKFLAQYIFIISNSFNAIILVGSIYVCFSRGYVFEEFSFSLFKNDIWGLSLIFTTIVALIILIQFFIERKGTLIIGELIKDTTNAIQCIKTLLIFPLIFYCVRAAAIFTPMYIGFAIKSINEMDYKLTNLGSRNDSCNCNDYQEGGFCNPIITSNCMTDFPSRGLTECILKCNPVLGNKLHDQLVSFAEVTNLFGYFWTSEYLYLLEHAILASTYATYYWTFHKRDIPTFTLLNGFWTTVRYHLGTIFFAWLFLCIYSCIRFTSTTIDGLLGFLPFSIIHFFFKYVVILTSLRGDNFYDSAIEVIEIVKTNARLIIVSKLMAEIIFFYLKLLITVAIGGLMYIVVLCFGLIKPDYFQHDLFPVYVVCMGTYLITTEIFNIYILGVDTFTFCFIEDISINNGELESPYFMPRPLMRICNLKNRLEKSSYDKHIK